MVQFLFAALPFCLAVAVNAIIADPGSFTQVTPVGLPTGVTNPTAAVIGENLYFTLVTGSGTTTNRTDLYRYSIGGQGGFAIVPGTSLPGSSYAADVEYVNGYFSVFGGENNSMTNTYYQIAAENENAGWEELTFVQPAPARSGHTLTLVGTSLYLFGGWNTNEPSPTYYSDMYTIDSSYFLNGFGRWFQQSTNGGPAARNGHSAVAFGGDLYIFGGFFHNVRLGNGVDCSDPIFGCLWYNDLWKFSTATNMWNLIVPVGSQIPDRRRDHSAVVLDGAMYVFGGQVAPCCDAVPAYFISNQLWRYDFSDNAWEYLRPVNAPPARIEHVAAVLGDRIYFYGGVDAHFQPLTDMWSYTPGLPAAPVPAPPTPSPITLEGLKAAVVVNILFTIGLLVYHLYYYRSTLRVSVSSSSSAKTMEPVANSLN